MNLTKTKKIVSLILCIVFAFSTMVVPCFATDIDVEGDSELNEVAAPVIELINTMLGVVLAVVGALGAIYCVFLGIKFAKAEEPQDREKAKAHLKNAIIGFVLIFVLILVLRLLMPVMTKWVNSNSKN